MHSRANPKLGVPRSATVLRVCSFATLLGAAGFLLTSILVRVWRPTYSPRLVPILFLALVTAACEGAYRIWYVWTEHRNSDRAFFAASMESTSIFENVLDGILIIDNEANCLDGNPAAAAILRVPRNQLVRRNIRSFMRNCANFERDWPKFLQRGFHRGLTEMLAGDGDTVFVDFAAATNYLAGRHLFILCDVTKGMRAEKALRESQNRFRYVTDNMQEIIWKMNADTKQVVYVNPAYVTITGHTIESLYRDPSFHSELVHPQDRFRILSRLEDVASTGLFDEEFRFVHADGSIRWLWVKARRANDDRGRWIIGTAQDITSRKAAEEKIAEQLEATESARAEAEALLKATLALSQNLAMDSLLDTLLQCIGELVPFDRASVLFVEDSAHLMVAREANRCEVSRVGFILSASENVYLHEILVDCEPVFLSNTDTESDWIDTVPFDGARSWMGIPLTAAGTVIGILSLCAYQPAALTTEHLRLARNLAVAAAVAIQNARVHERAAIYASELELRARELRLTQGLLEQFRRNSVQ
jgi:PAS domain S-box-containing protein